MVGEAGVEEGRAPSASGNEEEAGTSTACEECRASEAKYKCPACGVRTCSLLCVRAHKQRMSCSGVRDKTKYMPMDKLGDREMFSDISFLDDIKRVRDVARRSRPIPPRPETNLPHFMKTLRFQARKRGTRLLFLQPGMTRRAENTTYYHRGKDQLYWRLEWDFGSVQGTFADNKIEDTALLSEILMSHLTLRKENAAEYQKLRAYVKAGLDGIRVFLPLHKQRADQKEAHELDLRQTLCENLLGKSIVEFPVLSVRLRGQERDFTKILPSRAGQEVVGEGEG